ncbi:hypothetical protein [Rahnella perminowiae]|uniref:hypothetical protein n=1 Tax=Rahnella perminowiae TaxID=2816244 RepID=UPI003B8A7054
MLRGQKTAAVQQCRSNGWIIALLACFTRLSIALMYAQAKPSPASRPVILSGVGLYTRQPPRLFVTRFMRTSGLAGMLLFVLFPADLHHRNRLHQLQQY